MAILAYPESHIRFWNRKLRLSAYLLLNIPRNDTQPAFCNTPQMSHIYHVEGDACVFRCVILEMRHVGVCLPMLTL